MKEKVIYLFLGFVFGIITIVPFIVFSQNIGLGEILKGKILLRVENNGEAWYVNPQDKKRRLYRLNIKANDILLEIASK